MADLKVQRNDIVMGPGGVEAGRVEHVIVNELTDQITDLVVLRKDGTEFMVPIDNVTQQGTGVFLLRTPPERLANAHPFEPGQYHELSEEAVNATATTASSADNTVIHASHDAVIATGAHGAATPMTNMTSIPATPPMPSLSAHSPVVHETTHSEISHPTPPRPASTTPVMPSTPTSTTGTRETSYAGTGATAPHAHTTHTEMSGTSDTLREKPAPEGLKEQITGAVQEQVAATKAQVTDAVHDTLDTVKSSIHGTPAGKPGVVHTGYTNTDASQGIVDSVIATIRANPVPAALLGTGIFWLLRQRSSGSSNGSSYSYQGPSSSYASSSGSGYGYRGPSSSYASSIDRAPMYGRPSSSYGYRNEGPTRVSSFAYDEDVNSARNYTGTAPSPLDTIGDAANTAKSTVGHVVGQAGESVGNLAGATGNRVDDVVTMIRANPVPAALLGTGIFWLLRQRLNESSSGSSYSYRGPSSSYGYRNEGPTRVSSFAYDEDVNSARNYTGTAPSPLDTIGDAANTAKSTVGHVVGQAGESVGNLADAAGTRVSDLTGAAQQGVRQVGEGVGNLADAAGTRASDVTESVQQGARQAQSRVAQTLQESPMNIGVVALALGFAAGFLLPETPTENQLFGDSRDALLGQAQSQIQKAQRVAQDMQKVMQDMQEAIPQAIKESAQRQGLTGQS